VILIRVFFACTQQTSFGSEAALTDQPDVDDSVVTVNSEEDMRPVCDDSELTSDAGCCNSYCTLPVTTATVGTGAGLQNQFIPPDDDDDRSLGSSTIASRVNRLNVDFDAHAAAPGWRRLHYC